MYAVDASVVVAVVVVPILGFDIGGDGGRDRGGGVTAAVVVGGGDDELRWC